MKNTLYPDHYEDIRARQKEAHVWYSGAPHLLHKFYSTTSIDTEGVLFWKQHRGDRDTPRVHFPLAHNVAYTSANILFSDPPLIRIGDAAIEDTDYAECLDLEAFYAKLSTAAEICAGCGGVYLKVNGIYGMIEIEAIAPHEVYPIFAGDQLMEVTIYRAIMIDADEESGSGDEGDTGDSYTVVAEHRYLAGVDLHIDITLHRVSGNKILQTYALEDYPETKYLQPKTVLSNFNHLGVIYVPNHLPNNIIPSLPQGTPDFVTAYSMLDNLDENFTNWRRDIRLGKSTDFISSSLLHVYEQDSVTQKTVRSYRENTERFVAVQYEDTLGKEGAGLPILHVQADIRADEFFLSTRELILDIIRECGYSTQSHDYEMKNYVSTGAAISKMEHRTWDTKKRKQRYWRGGVRELLVGIGLLAQSMGYEVDPDRRHISVDFSDGASSDTQLLAESIRNIRQVQAMSIYTAVSKQHPDWTEAQITEEVTRINNEGSNHPAGRDMNIQNTLQEAQDVRQK
jgi:A118 family predicted phage portal protein